MAQTEHKIREYLLGQLSEADEEQVELRLLSEPDFAEEYDVVVSEVTDDYVAGKFAGEELKQVEEHFFKSTQRRDKLKFALALKERKADLGHDQGRKKGWYRPYLAIAASVLLIAGGGLYAWRVWSSDDELNKGLAALQSAFREVRPLEARLSDLPYAPVANQRGGPAEVDYVQRDRAGSLLLNAVAEHPTAASRHALGKYYLAEHQFDKAIEQFKVALQLDPSNAKIYNDLGVAWFEKGKIDRQGPNPGKGVEELDRSLENLNKALSLNPNLGDAVFNRALYQEYLLRPRDADEDWRRYLQLDPGSRWAEEVNQHIKALKQQPSPGSN